MKKLDYHYDIDYVQVDIGRLEQIEKEHLFNDALKYLSLAEKSPMDFSQWLNNRLLPSGWCDLLTKLVVEKKFLSETRFSALYANKWENKGGKPRWLVINELENKQVSLSIAEKIEYSDEKSVQNYLLRNMSKLKKDKSKWIDTLYKRGFSARVVESVIKKKI